MNGSKDSPAPDAGMMRVGRLPFIERMAMYYTRPTAEQSIAQVLLTDYATLELRAAAQLTPEQLKAMRQENENEADRT